MKKNLIKVKDFANLDKIKKQVKNALTEVEGEELKSALLSLIGEIEASEVELDEAALTAKIEEVLAGYKEVPAAVADAIQKVAQKMQNAVNPKIELSNAVKNQIAGAVLRAGNKDEIKNNVDKVLVKNNITGLTFADVIDFAVVTGWEKMNPLFEQLHETMFTKFFYTTEDMDVATAIAKQWDKTSAESVKKAVQSLTVEGKSITTKYIYKRQRAALEDLDEIDQAGQTSNFMTWISTELEQMIVNSIVVAMLVGDQTNVAADKITSFESIGTKAATDAFTYVKSLAVGSTPTLANYREIVDKVQNPNGKKKVLVISQADLTAISKFVYATGGTETYKSKEEVAGLLGVDEIFVSDYLAALAGVKAICMIPDGYWFKLKNSLEVAYPMYERNEMNYQREKNIGGAIHDLLSTSVLKVAQA